VLPFRRKRSLKHRAVARGRELRKAASQLDVPWARSWAARIIRESVLRFVLRPIMTYYARRRANGRDRLSRVKGPVILVANHASHMDTPVILDALPRRVRRKTAVAAASDKFYRRRLVAWLVSLLFNTVPIDRKGGGLTNQAAGHLDRLLDQGWNLLLYPEGTRSRLGRPGRVRRGAAVLAERHKLPVVPIRVTGTNEAMPPGRVWPKLRRGKVLPKRHRIDISFGEPIFPDSEDPSELIESVQLFFNQGNGDGNGSKPSKTRRVLARR
jgi:1-acyl-sn-glycerol-3-phosphate acyltransferase